MRVETETLVIGASAAGLATAAALRARDRAFEIVEAEDVVAASWRRHYDRLRLHTPKAFSGLPGLAMPKRWPRYPARPGGRVPRALSSAFRSPTSLRRGRAARGAG